MHRFKKAYGSCLIPGLILVAVFVCVHQAPADDPIPVKGSAYGVFRSDDSRKTYIDIVIGKRFSGELPGDIETIRVTGPGRTFILEKDDFTYNPLWRGFRCVRPGLPEQGEYTFLVSSGNRQGEAADTYAVTNTIPLADTRQFKPARGDEVNCTPPVFSWQRLDTDMPLFYQVQIRDADRRHVYRSEYVENMTSVRLPPDILEPDSSYQWRVRTGDGPDWLALNNRSQSRWVPFTTGSSLETCPYHYTPPEHIDGSWAVASLSVQNVNQQLIHDLMQQILGNRLKKIHGILLIKEGRLILEEYFSGYHRNLKHSVQSVTKSVTSILLGIARDRGHPVALDGKLAGYLPAYREMLATSAKGGITLEDLLTMRAGLEWNEFHMPTDVYNMIWSRDAVRYVLERNLVDPPGQRFHYSTGLSTVLGRILMNVTGSDALAYAEAHLFNPLDISDYFWGTTADGSYSTGAALWLRPRDMAKLGYLFLNNGKWRGTQVVSREWVRQSIHAHVTGERDMVSGSGYGYQWWRGSLRSGRRDIDVFYAAGHGGQYIVQIPELDVIIVTTSEYADNNAGDFRAVSAMVNYIVPAVLNTRPEKSGTGYQMEIEQFRPVTGKYRWEKGQLNLKIHMADGKLFGETILFDGRFRLLPVAENQFMALSDDVGRFRVKVMKDAKGKIRAVRLVIGFTDIEFQRRRGLLFGM